jgi:Domain of unknown function (DUF5658)
MSSASEEKQKEQAGGPVPSLFHIFTVETSKLQWLILLFLLVSIADLVMTYWLLSINPRVYESNPLANWFFAKWNIAGMTFFKFGVVALVVIISEFVEHRRAGAGKFVLILGILVTAAVVAYSYHLYLGIQATPSLR